MTTPANKANMPKSETSWCIWVDVTMPSGSEGVATPADFDTRKELQELATSATGLEVTGAGGGFGMMDFAFDAKTKEDAEKAKAEIESVLKTHNPLIEFEVSIFNVDEDDEGDEDEDVQPTAA